MVEHIDFKEKVKHAILHMEGHMSLFTRKDIAEHALKEGVSEADAYEIIDELIEDKFIYEVPGTEGPMFSRTVWRDYSPALEERPEI